MTSERNQVVNESNDWKMPIRKRKRRNTPREQTVLPEECVSCLQRIKLCPYIANIERQVSYEDEKWRREREWEGFLTGLEKRIKPACLHPVELQSAIDEARSNFPSNEESTS